MPLTHLNPEGLPSSPAFSQGVLVEPPGALLVVGGQNGVDESGQVVGDDLYAQTVQALRNVIAVLEAAGCAQADVARLSIYLVDGGDVQDGYRAAQEVWGPYPTALTVLVVAALARPECLVEIEALAQVPQQD